MYGNQPLHLAQNRRSKLSLSFFGLSLHHHILNLANHQSKPPRKRSNRKFSTMCRYITTNYSCGHPIERIAPTSYLCREKHCPRAKVAEITIGVSCSCPSCGIPDSSNRPVHSDHAQPKHDSGGSSNSSKFNPFYGQGGQKDEQTYRECVRRAYIKKQAFEWDVQRYPHHFMWDYEELPHSSCQCGYCESRRRVADNDLTLWSSRGVSGRPGSEAK